MSRFGYVMVTYFVVLLILVFSFFHHRPRLMWNATASVPIGLYILKSPGPLSVGDLVADQPPLQLSRYMAGRHYLPPNAPLLKFVGAITDQTVCRNGLVISIDGLAVATALMSDHARRHLPDWQGCHILKSSEVFLLNPTAPDSFDGRYFGVLPANTVTARAELLWREGDN